MSKSTTVIYIRNDDVEAYKRTDPFADSVPVPDISKMHVMISNCENTQLWLNSAHQKSDSPSITICNKSFNQFSLNSVTAPPLKNPLSYHDVAKVTKRNFAGFYAIVTETGDLNNLSYHDEVEINYLKPSFGKWVVNTNDHDSREIGDLVHVSTTIDGRSRYSITEYIYAMYCMSMKHFALLNIDYCYDFCKYFCVVQRLFMKETFPCICCCFCLYVNCI